MKIGMTIGQFNMSSMSKVSQKNSQRHSEPFYAGRESLLFIRFSRLAIQKPTLKPQNDCFFESLASNSFQSNIKY
jgi:hypothetical protein